MIIAVDGPAASGKGTLAAALAAHYGLAHLDTGLLYRAVGRDWLAFENDADTEARAVAIAENLDANSLDAAALSSAEIGQAASKVGAFPGVRAALLQFQRDFAAQAGGAVLDGRDIGTVICPDADVKLYVTASAQIRAERRAAQLEADGKTVDRAAMLADIKARDARDSGRVTAPMRRADDAHLLDTTEMDIPTALRTAVAMIDAAIADRAGA